MPFISNWPVDDLDNKYDQYANMLFKLCLVILSSESDAEDAVQESFIRYIRKKPKFNDSGHEKAWFIKVATNICRDMRRFTLKHKTVNITELSDYYQDKEQGYILEQILTLPSKYKCVIHLYYVEGYKVNEIAKIIGTSQSAVKMRLLRGRKLLKIELEEEYNL